jgi:hypothetical protein
MTYQRSSIASEQKEFIMDTLFALFRDLKGEHLSKPASPAQPPAKARASACTEIGDPGSDPIQYADIDCCDSDTM